MFTGQDQLEVLRERKEELQRENARCDIIMAGNQAAIQLIDSSVQKIEHMMKGGNDPGEEQQGEQTNGKEKEETKELNNPNQTRQGISTQEGKKK